MTSMITIQISTNIIKASTYTDLLNTFLQSNDTQFIKMQNAAQEILENKFKNHLEEDEAKYIWNQILDYYPKVEIKGILYDPLKQWYKVEIYNKDTKELYNAKFIKETVAELSAAVLTEMLGISGYEQQAYEYIKTYTEGKKDKNVIISITNVLNTVQKVVEKITSISEKEQKTAA